MASLICGSLAFDAIMSFEGRFAEQILPDQLHILNVSFLVPALRRDFGGCAGNIAYSLKQLGGTPLPMATLGQDGADDQLDLVENHQGQNDNARRRARKEHIGHRHAAGERLFRPAKDNGHFISFVEAKSACGQSGDNQNNGQQNTIHHEQSHKVIDS